MTLISSTRISGSSSRLHARTSTRLSPYTCKPSLSLALATSSSCSASSKPSGSTSRAAAATLTSTLSTPALPLPILPIPSTKTTHARKRSEGHIKRPRNAFILFRSAFIAQRSIPQEVEGDHRNLSRIIGQVWRRMSVGKKEPWIRMAKEERLRHREEYPEFKYGSQAGSRMGTVDAIKSGERIKMKETEDRADDVPVFTLTVNSESSESGSDTCCGRGTAERRITGRHSSSCPPPNSIPISTFPAAPLLETSTAALSSHSSATGTPTSTALSTPTIALPMLWPLTTTHEAPQGSVGSGMNATITGGVTHDDIVRRRPSLATIYHTNPSHSSSTPLLDLGTQQQILSSQSHHGYCQLPLNNSTTLQELGLSVDENGWVWGCSKACMQQIVQEQISRPNPNGDEGGMRMDMKMNEWDPNTIPPSQLWYEGNGIWDSSYYLFGDSENYAQSIGLDQVGLDFTNPFASEFSFASM